MNFSPALPRQAHILVAHYTNVNLPAFNMEPSAGYHSSVIFRALVDDIPGAEIQGRSDVEDVSQAMTQARHHSLAKTETMVICSPVESFKASGKASVKCRHLQALELL